MNALVTEKHTGWRTKVRDFAESEIKPVIGDFESREEYPAKLVKAMGRLNVFGMHVPLKYGGQATDYLSYIIAVEELARVDSSMAATLAAHNSLGAGPILEFGTEKQKQHYLPDLCTGKNVWAFGLTEENAGSDAQGVETIAEEAPNGWLVHGSKKYITNGASELSAGITIVAKSGVRPDGRPEHTAFLVERKTPGFTSEWMKGKLLWRAADNANLYFNNCQISSENVLGERGQGVKIMLKTIDSGRLSIAAMGLGLAQGAFEMAIGYAKKRKQFGQPIANFQVISFKLADMAVKIEHARNTLYHACWLKDNGKAFGKQAAMAKLYCAEIAREVADETLQIFGGAGLFRNDEFPIERFYRDQRLLQIGEGTSEILRMVIARSILNDSHDNRP